MRRFTRFVAASVCALVGAVVVGGGALVIVGVVGDALHSESVDTWGFVLSVPILVVGGIIGAGLGARIGWWLSRPGRSRAASEI